MLNNAHQTHLSVVRLQSVGEQCQHHREFHLIVPSSFWRRGFGRQAAGACFYLGFMVFGEAFF